MNLFRRLFVPRTAYQPLIEVRISKVALLHNLGEFKTRYPGMQFAPVIKSNAYGHGMVTVARLLDDEPKAFFMVDSFYEALVLRRAGIRSKILMLGYNRIEQLIDPKLKNCAVTIVDFSILQEVVLKLKKPDGAWIVILEPSRCGSNVRRSLCGRWMCVIAAFGVR